MTEFVPSILSVFELNPETRLFILKQLSELYERAPYIIIGSLAILVLFLWFLIWELFVKSWRLGRRLDRLRKQIERAFPSSGINDEAGLVAVKAIFAGNHYLSECWDEFEETLLLEPSADGKKRVFNTRNASEYFTRDAVITPYLNLEFHQNFPSILTGIGLMITFLAILLGLGNVVQEGKIVSAEVATLVANLSGKFVSSIVAIACSVVYTFGYHWCVSSVDRRFRLFTSVLDRKLARRSMEYLLAELLRNSVSEREAFQHFNTDLAGKLREGVGEGLKPTFDRLLDVLNEIKERQSKSLSDSVGGMVSEFRDSLLGATGQEMNGLASTLKQVSDVLLSSISNGRDTQEKTSQLMGQLDLYLSRQEAASTQQLEKLMNAVADAAERLRESGAQSGMALSEKMASALDRLETTASNILKGGEERQELVAEATNNLMERMRGEFKEATDRFESMISQTIDKMGGTSSGQIEQLSKTVGEVAERLKVTSEETMKGVTGAVDYTVKNLISSSKGEASAAYERIKSLLQEEERRIKEIEGSLVSLRAVASSFHGLVSENKNLTQEYQNAGRALNGILADMGRNAELVNTASREFNTAALRSKENLEKYESVLKEQEHFLGNYQKVLDSCDKSVASILGKFREETQKLSSAVSKILTENLTTFDNHMGTAVKRLGGSIEELGEELSELQGIFHKTPHS